MVSLKAGTDLFERLGERFPSYAELATTEEVLPPRGPVLDLAAGDVLYVRCQGGGGYGDPLDREPEAVQRDVAQGYVSPAKALAVYGVALAPDGAVDAAATVAQRAAIRRDRLGDRPPQPGDPPDQAIVGWRSTPDLVWDGGAVRCRRCGTELGADQDGWRTAAAWRERPLAVAGAPTDLQDRVVLREYACPGCATLLDVLILPRDATQAGTSVA